MRKKFVVFGFILFSIGILIGFWLGGCFYRKTNETLISNFVVDQEKKSIKLPEVVLIAGGDMMLGRKVGYTMVRNNNFRWPFEKVADVIRSADVSFFNLESPFCSDCGPAQTGMIFCADLRAIEGLVFAGVDGVNLSNNHIRNYGEAGLKDTKDLLRENEIGYFGEGENPLLIEIKGVKFAFLGYNEVGLGEKAYENLKNQVRDEVLKSRSLADVLVVSFHWGNEYTTKITLRQKELSYLAIDSGADIVVGHHPHWVQEKEVYQGKPIYYSLGNFIFDQMWSEETKRGVLVRLVFRGREFFGDEFLPFEIFNFGQPIFEGDYF